MFLREEQQVATDTFRLLKTAYGWRIESPIQHQRIIVEKIGDVAEARLELAGYGAQVGRFEQQRDQRQVRALDLERGRGASCEGNGH